MKQPPCPADSWTLYVTNSADHPGYLRLTTDCHGGDPRGIVRTDEYDALVIGELLDVIDATISQPHYHGVVAGGVESPAAP